MYGKLYCELGIEPIKLAPGDNSFYWDKKWYQGISGKDANALYNGFKRLNAEAAQSIKILPTEDTPASMTSAQLARLDSTPFAATLKGYPPQFLALLNSICKSACCGTIEQLSALSGLYLVEDLASSNYVFKGGNPAIAKALTGKLNQSGDSRMVSGAFVWKIELTENGAVVAYSDRQGNPHTVSCNHVIVSTPPMVAWRQIKNMDDKMRALLMPMKYGSYLVANCLMGKKLFSGTYDSWFTAPFTIADVTVAETPYIKSNSYKPEMGSVLTVYQPWEPGSEGRTLLLAGDRPKLAKMMRDQVAQFVSQLDSQLEEIVLSRWGHAMVVTGPGYYARLQKIANAQTGPYTLAHNSTQGLPSAESAIRAARFAADRAKQMAAKPAVTVP
jgi:protoporphyrinogen oxidase